ncbi:MAG: hypothetical protein ACE5KI_03015 [Dehalococcoidia bacterium]
MKDSGGDALLLEMAEDTIQGNPEAVDKWVTGEAGSWGFLAGQAVIALRKRLGRKLEEHERRRVWSLLWERLAALKEGRRSEL